MADILTQQEVDALLSGLDTGTVPSPEPPTTEERGGLPTYDFRRPEWVSREQAQAIQALHETLARSLGMSLSGCLRTAVDSRLISVDPSSYAEFVKQLANPTCLRVLSAAPLEGSVILELHPSLVFPIIDKLLGGQSAAVDLPDRPLTEIEQGLISRVVQLIVDALREAWRPVQAIDFSVASSESDPRRLQLLPPDEKVIIAAFELRIGEAGGPLNICLPQRTVQPLLNSLAGPRKRNESENDNESAGSRSKTAGPDAVHLAQQLGRVSLPVSAVLARTRLTVAQLLDLELGDVIATEQHVSAPIQVRVAGRPKFAARAGTKYGKRAVRIVGWSERA